MWRGRGTSRLQTIFPVLRSSANVINLSPSLAVRKIRSAVTTGEDRANGTEAFHARFFFGPNSAGSTEASATPAPFGPRNCSHSLLRFASRCAATDDVKKNKATAIIDNERDLLF